MPNLFTVKIRSKNHSLKSLRGNIKVPFKSVVRLGSTTPTKEIWPVSISRGQTVIEINTVNAIHNSRSKLLMKYCFDDVNIPHSAWWETYQELTEEKNIPYPVLAKRVFGFKGKGMFKLDSKEELSTFVTNRNLDGYYFEKFHNYSREYRLHCTEDGCFYAVRKMLKEDTPDDKKWYRNDSNCIWATEYEIEKNIKGDIINYNELVDNKLFDKPVNWSRIESDCVKALNSTGLTIGAFDVKIQSAIDGKGNKKKDPLYIVIEVNSAPSFGGLTLIKYQNKIPEILNKEYYKLIS